MYKRSSIKLPHFVNVSQCHSLDIINDYFLGFDLDKNRIK